MTDYNWTDAQIMAARAITLIKRNMEPTCATCGVGADRPNCANDMGGYCQRHDQEDVRAYNSVIESIARAADFPKDWTLRWDLYMPIYLYNDFSETELALLSDLVDAGGTMKSRKLDERFNSLASKKAVGRSSQYNMWFVTISNRGTELLEWAKKNVIA